MLTKIKSCNGCKHLHNVGDVSVCDAADPKPIYTQNPYTGRVSMYHGFVRPYVQMMRAHDGPCGQDAMLYEPTIARRILNFVLMK